MLINWLRYNYLRLKDSYYKLNNKKLLNGKHVTLFMILPIMFFTILPGYASSDAYDSGYDHGCDDSRISDPSERYINQPEKGPAFHTGSFMDGYNAGFSQCSSSRGGDDDGTNGNSGNGGNGQGTSQSGYAQGKSDYQNNRPYDDRCDPDMPDLACALYKADYAAGWGATGILRPETRND